MKKMLLVIVRVLWIIGILGFCFLGCYIISLVKKSQIEGLNNLLILEMTLGLVDMVLAPIAIICIPGYLNK